jgi:hypothetical protein
MASDGRDGSSRRDSDAARAIDVVARALQSLQFVRPPRTDITTRGAEPSVAVYCKESFMFSKYLAPAAIVISMLAATASAEAGSYRVRARLSAGNDQVQAKSEYRERQRANLLEKRFKVEVEDAAPGDAFDIAINGVQYGTIFANDLGIAELNFRTIVDDNPGDPNENNPFPDNFPRIASGDSITVGSMSGTFR